MDHVVMQPHCIIAAGAVVLENTIVEAGSIYAGVPARKVKEIEPGQFKAHVEEIAARYVMYASWYAQ